jgi:FkbM family methyltransferase
VTDIDSDTDDAPADGGADRRTFRLGPAGSEARVYATGITRRRARHGAVMLPPELERWLAADITPGDVLYDVGAGAGECSILAALDRGAAAVAFEPGFAAFNELCENIILNGCGRSVVPVPAALTDRAGLRALTYPHAAGSDRHALRDREWRLGREAPADRYTQPVCADSLDELVRRQRLPPPQALRIAVRSGADAVLRGAAAVVTAHRPRSILVLVRDAEQAAAVRGAAADLGYDTGEAGASAADSQVALRFTPGSAPLRPRPWGTLRRAAGRVRARG